MSLDAHLIHTCIIQRATRTTDAYGNVVETWSDAATDVACRLVAKTKTMFVSETAEKAVLVSYLLLVRGDVDVRDRDRVSQVTYEDGSVETRTFSIESLLNRRGGALHHKSAFLSVVQ
jgi:head-tail adaptor